MSWLSKNIGFVLVALGVMVAGPPNLAASDLQVADLKTEYRIDPIGLDAPRPRLSWILNSQARNTVQSAYQIYGPNFGRLRVGFGAGDV